jgi:hypothetical protein
VNPRAIVWQERLGQLKNPRTSSGIEPATFWFVTKPTNYATACPVKYGVLKNIIFQGLRYWEK